MPETQFTLQSHGVTLYGTDYTPPDAENIQEVFVFCHPLLEEKKSCQRVFVELARVLTHVGTAACIFDLSGCGDSDGDIADFTTDNWLADINAIRSRFPEAKVNLLGVRFGALLAFCAAASCQGVSKLVLIDPVVDGAKYVGEVLQQKLIREMMTFGADRNSKERMMEQLEAGASIDLDGVALSKGLYDSITDLKAGAGNFPKDSKMLLVQYSAKPDPSPQNGDLIAELEKQGVDVDFQAIRMLSFWKAVDMADSGGLQEIVLNWSGLGKET